MKFNHNILFVSSPWLKQDSPALQSLEELKRAVAERGFSTSVTNNLNDAVRLIQENQKYSAIGIYWDANNPDMSAECEHFVKSLRQRNTSTPLFLLSEEDITAQTPLSLLKEVSEYIYLFSETATFTANRIYTLVHRYAENLLPPYFKTLKNFTEDGDYYWDCR